MSTSDTVFFGAGTVRPGVASSPVQIFSWNDFVTGVIDPSPALAVSLASFFENGGTAAWISLTADESAGTLSAALDAWTGPPAGLSNILTVPALPELGGGDYDQVAASLGTAADASGGFALYEPPFPIVDLAVAADDYGPLVAFADHLRSVLPKEQWQHGAFYVADFGLSDMGSAVPSGIRLPVTGAVAGIYTTNDENVGVWDAPAGTKWTVAGVDGSTVAPSVEQANQLNESAANTIIDMTGYGTVIWGARTLAGSDLEGSPNKYVSTTRLATYIQESLETSLTWAVFEPNGPALWASLQTETTAFMHELYQQGAFVGGTDAEAYTVTCDSSTTSPADQQNGVVRLNVQFAPTLPTEMIEVSIVLQAQPS